MNPSILLVVSDVDGTLLTPTHEVTRRAREAVKKLAEAGIRFTLASSRPPRGMDSLIERLDITVPFAPFNGAQIVTPEGTVLAKQIIPAPLIQKVQGLCADFHLNLWVYQDAQWFASQHDEFVEREESTAGFHAEIDEHLERHFENCPKLTVVGPPDKVALCRQTLLEKLGSDVEATCSKPRFLDITIKSANKGAVITNLSRILHIPAQQIAAIGDGPNDMGMFAQAGLSIAMGNGSEAVRRAAQHVTTSNQEEGFAHGVERFVLGGGTAQTESGAQ